MKEVKSYYEDKTSEKGLISISDKVFSEIAENVLNDRLKENKGRFALENGKQKAMVKSVVVKNNNVTVQAGLFLPIGADTKILGDIQKAIYDEIFEATEISSLKVDIILLGCYPVSGK